MGRLIDIFFLLLLLDFLRDRTNPFGPSMYYFIHVLSLVAVQIEESEERNVMLN